MRRTRPITIDFTGTALKTVERLAAERGVSFAEVIRNAVSREAWYRQVESEGGRLCVRTKDGQFHEVEFVR